MAGYDPNAKPGATTPYPNQGPPATPPGGPSYGAAGSGGPDSFDTAMAGVDREKLALLESIARAGSAGRVAYDQARAQVQTSGDAALSMALGNNAPQWEGRDAQIQQTVQGPLAQRQQAMSQQYGTFQQDLARQQAAGEQYLGGISAALPTQRAAHQWNLGEIDRQKAAAAELHQSDLDAAFREHQAEIDADMAYKQWAAEFAASQGGGSGGGGGSGSMTQAELEAWIIGEANKQQAADVAAQNDQARQTENQIPAYALLGSYATNDAATQALNRVRQAFGGKPKSPYSGPDESYQAGY